MNAPKVDELDYIHFVVATQQVFTTTEAVRIRQGSRMLRRMTPIRVSEALVDERLNLLLPPGEDFALRRACLSHVLRGCSAG